MGLMDRLRSPEGLMYLSGVGGALSRSSAPGGAPFDLSQTNALFTQQMMAKRAKEKLSELLEKHGEGYTPQQRSLLETYAQQDPQGALGIMTQQAFGEGKKYLVDHEIELLRSTGLSRDEAIRTLKRHTVSRDPFTGAVQIIDKATGEPVQTRRAQAPQAATGPAAGGQPPPEQGGLYGDVTGSTGVVPGLQELATDTLGQLPGEVGEFFQFPNVVESRQNIRTAAGNMFRAMSANPKIPVAEINRIREQIKIEPGALTSEEGLRARMRSVAEFLKDDIAAKERTAADEGLPMDTRQEAAAVAEHERQFLKQLGVPAAGTAAPQQQAPNMPPAPTSPPPEGVDENEWRWMTPEERSLWQN